MRFLGGKYRIRKQVAAVVQQYGQGRTVWEPFCGGLNSAGAHPGRVICSDAEPSLIHLYQAVAAGWDPPKTVTEADYHAAKQLPVTDPMHGFYGYGCSFGGKQWGGYARPDTSLPNRNFARAARNAVLRDVGKIASNGGSFFLSDFCDVAPSPGEIVIYTDPPYHGTTEYHTAVDRARFLARCREWVGLGVPVLVSEYDLPIGDIVWERERPALLRGKAKTHLERIYLISPEAAP